MLRAIATLLISVLMLFSVNIYSAVDLQKDIAQLQQQLDLSVNSSIPSEQEKRAIQQKIISALKEQELLQNKIGSLQSELELQPKVLQAIETRLSESTSPLPDIAYEITLAELEKRETQTNARVLELNRTQAEYRQTASQAEERQQTIREQLANLKFVDFSDDKPQFAENSDLATQLQSASFAEYNLRQQALELELLVLPKRAEIAKLNGQLLERELKLQNQYLNSLGEFKQVRQRAEAELALRELEKSAEADSEVQAIQLLRKENQQLSQQLRALLVDIESYDQERRAEQIRLSQLTTSFNLIRQQLELEVSHITPAQIQFIFENRTAQDTRKVSQEIAQLRLQRAQLEQRLNVSGDKQATQEAMPSLNKAQLRRFQNLLDDQKQLLNQLSDAQSQLSLKLNQILNIQRQVNQQISSNRETISRHLLWNPVTPELDSSWFKEIGISSEQVYGRLVQATEQPLFKSNDKTPGRIVLFIVIMLGVLWLRGYAASRTSLWAKQLGNVVHDRLMHTFKAVLLGPLLTIYLPAGLLIVGKNLVNQSHPDADQLEAMLQVVAILGWFLLSMRFWLTTPDGLFCIHFGVSEELCLLLRKLAYWVLLVCVPLIMFHAYIWDIDSDEMRSGLVRLVIFLLLFSIGYLFFRLWRSVPQINQIMKSKSWWLRAELWLSLLILVNFSLIVLVGLGYTFTVNLILYAGSQLAFLLLLTFMFYKLGLRLVLISERRLEFDRAKARRAEILAARENPDEEPPLETNYLNMQTISDQSRTLLKTATVVVLGMLIWAGMGGYLPLFGVLDNIELWSSVTSDGETALVTLKSVIFGVVVLSLCLLAAYNLPGLLELLILRNLDLSPGTGYAISSLLKYTLIMVGILLAFSSFGLEWGKLQWLVAALGVGLGFGLQEIVANFVSGLIILFEKPVRIGDTVTIDGLTGTVTRIQIRATTITDWDRKEVIIPNKAFITQQLINWSLTDSITRVVVPVGIAYGSDTDLARELLLEAAQEEERVLRDPKPEAFFTQFADSSLNLELRFYVSAMVDRLEMNHRVNTRVADKFKQAGIEIAFPQLDVHLKRN